MLDKQAILDVKDLPVTTVDVPEWGGQVGVRVMTGAERDAFEKAVIDRRTGEAIDMRGLKVALVCLCLCDENGERLFTEAEANTLANKSGRALDRVFAVAQKANGLTEQDVEDLAGNSGADLNA